MKRVQRGAAYACLLLLAIVLGACRGQAPQVTPQLVRVYASSAVTGKLADLYSCSSPSTAILLADPQTADITLRLGPPDPLSTPAFQIGTDDVVVIVHPQTGVGNLTADQIHSIFLGQVADWKQAGGSDLPLQVWTYAAGEDIQQIFEQAVMDGQPVTSLARLAVSAQDMLDSVAGSVGSIGYLPASLRTNAVQEVYRIRALPLLAITKAQPEGAVRALIACLQK